MPTTSKNPSNVQYKIYKDKRRVKVKITAKGICFHKLIRGQWTYPTDESKFPSTPPCRKNDYNLLVDLFFNWGIKSVTFKNKYLIVDRDERVQWPSVLKNIHRYLGRYLDARTSHNQKK